MKIPKPLFLLLAAFGAFAGFGTLTPVQARADESAGYFYDTLDPYGEWIDDPDYGYVWHPAGVDENWAPYTDGYWAYTDDGWTWVSYEDYGGIVYHYGRWTFLPGEGWVWVPGYQWAPAWVSWRYSDDYVGWAPLPPEARWQEDTGFSGWVDSRFDIGPGFYSFVAVRDFGAPALGSVILRRDRNLDIIRSTRNITNITTRNSQIYTGGPSFARIAARSGRPIPTLKLVRQTDAQAAAGGKVLSHRQGNQLVVIAPSLTAPAEGAAAPTPRKVAKTLSGVKAEHGWSGVKDPAVKEKLQAQFKSQASTAGASAKAVNEEDVKIVDDKIKAQGASKALAGENLASPTPKKGKGKSTENADLLNSAATMEPGTTPGATPKTKGKKSHATPESAFQNTEGSAENTPEPGVTPKTKGKKSHAATESSFLETQQETQPGAESTPKTKSKKSKTPSDTETAPSGLQPFDAQSGGKSRFAEPGVTGEATPNGKEKKSDKKHKEQEPSPAGQ